MSIRTRRRPLSQAEWEDFAGRFNRSHHELVGLYGDLLKTATVQEAEILRSAIRRLQAAKSRIENLMCRQLGDDEGMRLLYGDDGVHLA
jgi:hypothetical protein